jgi:hypothetical protein
MNSKLLAAILGTVLLVSASTRTATLLSFAMLPVLTACADACEEAEQKCEDRGLEAVNCERQSTLLNEECECDCVSSSE